jgi:integrase
MDKRFISAVLNYCISINEWNYPNPLRNLKSAKAQESEMYFLTTKEIETLLLHIKTTCRRQELYLKIIKICLSTGARIREVTSLRGSQISKYRITYIKTKGKKNRSVPVSKELYDYIYQDTSAELFYDCTKGIAAMIKKLFPRGQATHVLRHTFASHFMMNGGNLLVLRQILGHSSVTQTMVYAHLSPTHLEDAVSKNPLVGINIQ